MADSTITGSGPFWEVQGLALCPQHSDQKRNRGACKVPVDGEWHAVFFLANEQEARNTLSFVMDSDSVWLDHFEDFRMVPPNEKSARRVQREADKRASFASQSRGESERAAVKPVKGKKRKAAAA